MIYTFAYNVMITMITYNYIVRFVCKFYVLPRFLCLQIEDSLEYYMTTDPEHMKVWTCSTYTSFLLPERLTFHIFVVC